MNEVKQSIEFIKEKYQVKAEFNYLIEKIIEYIQIGLKIIFVVKTLKISHFIM